MGEHCQIMEELHDKQLLALEVIELPWYGNITNYLDIELFPPGAYF